MLCDIAHRPFVIELSLVKAFDGLRHQFGTSHSANPKSFDHRPARIHKSRIMPQRVRSNGAVESLRSSGRDYWPSSAGTWGSKT